MSQPAGTPTNGRGLPVRTESRADFETHDPGAKPRAGETRFLCPFPDCAGHQEAPGHRSLSYNEQSGLWRCHRCGTAGQDPARWKAAPATGTASGWKSRRERQRDNLARFFAVPTSKPPKPAEGPEAATVATVEAVPLWRLCVGTVGPLDATPGASYLEGRGLPVSFCAAAGVRFAPDYYADKETGKRGRAAVLFPIRDRDGRTVAAQGRFLDKNATPKTLTTRGGLNGGLFVTPGALDGPLLVIAEAPIDALTLALCGFPAVATCGASNFPDRLKRHALRRVVVLAYDSDTAGDAAADKVTAALALAAPLAVYRLRPEGAKDWNELLQTGGRDALTAFLADFHGRRIAPLLPVVDPVDEAVLEPTSEPEVPETGGENAGTETLDDEVHEAPSVESFPEWLALLVTAERAGQLPNLREPLVLPSGAAVRDIGAAVRNGVTLWRGAAAHASRNAPTVASFCPRRRALLALPWHEIAKREEADLCALAERFQAYI